MEPSARSALKPDKFAGPPLARSGFVGPGDHQEAPGCDLVQMKIGDLVSGGKGRTMASRDDAIRQVGRSRPFRAGIQRALRGDAGPFQFVDVRQTFVGQGGAPGEMPALARVAAAHVQAARLKAVAHVQNMFPTPGAARGRPPPQNSPIIIFL